MFEGLISKYRYEKENMNKVRFRHNYIYMPVLFMAVVFDLIVMLVLLLSKTQILVPIIICLAVLFACFVFLIVLSVLVKKQEIEIEAEKLKFFFSSDLLSNPVCEYVLPTAESNVNVDLIFSENGIKISELEYSYDGFECSLFTSNFMHQVNLVLMFARTDKGDEEDGVGLGVSQFSLPLNLNLMSLMNKFKIKIKNPDVLRFIKDYPEISAKQILTYGKIQNDYDKLEEKIKAQQEEEKLKKENNIKTEEKEEK